MQRSALLLLSTYLVINLASATRDSNECLPEVCPGPDCPPRQECQYYVDDTGEPYLLPHATNCSRLWLCEPGDPVKTCLYECAACPSPRCPEGTLYFDPSIPYPNGPVCNWPDQIDCTPKTCPLPCQVPDENGVCHPECCVDADCHGDTLCDQNTHTCVHGCMLNEDCDNSNGICPTCQWCKKTHNGDTGKCEPGCLRDDQCQYPTPVCQNHHCVPSRYFECCVDSDCYGDNPLCDQDTNTCHISILI